MVLLLLEINHDIRRMIREILELVYDLWKKLLNLSSKIIVLALIENTP